MPAETPEPHAGRRRGGRGRAGSRGHEDLTTVRRRAHTRRRVHGEPDVPGLRQRRTTAVDADANANLRRGGRAVRAGSPGQLALDGHGRLDRVCDTLEDGEELVGPRVDLASAAPQTGFSHD